jgi:hypothetical protein
MISIDRNRKVSNKAFLSFDDFNDRKKLEQWIQAIAAPHPNAHS